MPTRKFTRGNVRWRVCPYCGNDFPDSRKDRVYDKTSCRVAVYKKKTRAAVISKRGGKCHTCGKGFNPARSTPFFVLQDGAVLCGGCHSRRSREKFYKRWPKGKLGYQRARRDAKKSET